MSRIGGVFLLILLAGRCFSQDYFVLIQADNKQPFYVRLGDKTISSSAEGSLILGQLKDTVYNFAVGFPGQSSSDQLFRVDMHHKDQQFILRNQDDKGWILYNPLTAETRTTEPKIEIAADLKPQGIKKDDAFSRLMAGVVHDTAVMYNTYAMEQTLRDSVATAGAQGQKPVGASEPPSDSASSTTSAVKPAVSSPPSTAMVPATNPASGGASPATPPVTGQSPPADSSRASIVSPTENAASMPIDTLAAIRALRDSLRRMVEGTSTRTPVNTNASSATPAASPKPDSMPIADPSAVAAPPPPLHRAIVKLSERKLTRSLRLVYADKAAGQKTDTIVMLIPLDTLATAKTRLTTGASKADTAHRALAKTTEPGAEAIASGNAASSITPANSGRTSNTSGPPGSGANSGGTATTGSSVAPGSTNPSAGETAKTKTDSTRKGSSLKPAIPFVNSDCHAFATDYDVDRLRVKMLQSSKDEDRIQLARKIFKTKCFNTRQIKALSEVFTTDAQKYKFYETAYPFASDDQFRELGSTLADPVYNSKFKTMTGQ